MNNWEIIDNAGTIHTGTEQEMRFALKVMQEPDNYSADAKKKYYKQWKEYLKLIQIHQIHK